LRREAAYLNIVEIFIGLFNLYSFISIASGAGSVILDLIRDRHDSSGAFYEIIIIKFT